MNRRRLIFACSGLLLLPVLPCAGLMLWVRSQTTYYVAAYRVASVVDAGSDEEQRRRLYPVEFDSCTLEFEWYAYDNPDITAGPYKLFVVATPKTPHLNSVTIVSIQIESDRGASYLLVPPGEPVLTLTADQNQFSDRTVNSLAFDFEGQEEIKTTMVIQFDLGTEVQTETLTLRWKPVLLRQWSSIV